MLALALAIYAPINLASVFVKEFGLYLPLFSVGFGICNGLTYMVPMHHAWLWCPSRPGLISGIVVGGFGLGSFVFSLVCEHIANPDKLDDSDPNYEQVIKDNVPKMKLIFCLSNIASSLVSILMVFQGPDPSSVKEVKKTLEKQASSQHVLSTMSDVETQEQTHLLANLPQVKKLEEEDDDADEVIEIKPSHSQGAQSHEKISIREQKQPPASEAAMSEKETKNTLKPTKVKFVDVIDPTKAVDKIDVDKVVLSFPQQLRLCSQCLKTVIFWKIYAMQFCAICK